MPRVKRFDSRGGMDGMGWHGMVWDGAGGLCMDGREAQQSCGKADGAIHVQVGWRF